MLTRDSDISNSEMGISSSANGDWIALNTCDDGSSGILFLGDIYEQQVFFWQIDGKNMVEFSIILEVFGELFGTDFALHLFQIIHLDIFWSLDGGSGGSPSGKTVIVDVANVSTTVTQVYEEVVFLLGLAAQTIFALYVFLLLFTDLCNFNSSSIIFIGLVLNWYAVDWNDLEFDFSQLD